MYVPPDTMLNKDFLRLILADDKKLMPLAEVKWISVPRYDELSIKNLFDAVKEDQDVMAYFPDSLPKGRQPDRTYFFNILNSVHSEYTRNLISVAQKYRYQAGAAQADQGVVQVSDAWWSKLNELPFISCKLINKPNPIRT